MKLPSFAIGLTVLSVASVQAQNASESTKVVGIVDLLNYRCALLHPLDRQTRFGEYLMLKEGERESDLTVIEINPQEKSLRVNLGANTNVLLKMSDLPSDATGVAASEKKTLLLKDISLHPLLDLYSQFSGRTILRHPELTVQNFTLSAAPTNEVDAATVLEKAFAEKEIVSIKDREKFMMVVPKSEEKNVHPASAEHKQSAEVSVSKAADENNKQGKGELIPIGTIDFREMDLANVAYFYALLTGADPDRENLAGIRGSPIVFRTRTALNNDEVKYALDTLFAWQGFKAARGKDGTVTLRKIDSK